MEFCESCGSVMHPSRSSSGRVYLLCPKCGKRKMNAPRSFKIVEKIEENQNVLVVDTKDTRPTTEKMCPKCGNQEAYFWVQQTRSIDEPPTQFFECRKCGNIWREY